MGLGEGVESLTLPSVGAKSSSLVHLRLGLIEVYNNMQSRPDRIFWFLHSFDGPSYMYIHSMLSDMDRRIRQCLNSLDLCIQLVSI